MPGLSIGKSFADGPRQEQRLLRTMHGGAVADVLLNVQGDGPEAAGQQVEPSDVLKPGEHPPPPLVVMLEMGQLVAEGHFHLPFRQGGSQAPRQQEIGPPHPNQQRSRTFHVGEDYGR